MKIIKKQLTRFGVFLLVCAGVSSSYAGNDAMDRDLKQMTLILQQFDPLIQKAIKDQDPEARVKFRFERLHQDVEKILSGIQTALSHQPIQPKTVRPLEGDYID
jgi:RAQPRD family integrative conjugative element protein